MVGEARMPAQFLQGSDRVDELSSSVNDNEDRATKVRSALVYPGKGIFTGRAGYYVVFRMTCCVLAER
jgi:hypothetical protein